MKQIRIAAILASIFCLLGAHSSSAGFYRGNDLVEDMHAFDKAQANDQDADFSKAWRFRGYVVGVVDASEHLYDLPSNVGEKQICAVVSKYLKDHPERWDREASNLVAEAISEAFPRKDR